MPTEALLEAGYTSLGRLIETWEAQHNLPMSYALIGDATGSKSVPAGHTKRFAVARVSESVLDSFEPIVAGERTFTVENPVAGGKEVLTVVGTVRLGVMELVVSPEESGRFFDGGGGVGEVVFLDTVGVGEGRRSKRAAKKRRQRENRKKAKEKEKGDGDGGVKEGDGEDEMEEQGLEGRAGGGGGR